MSGTCSTIDAVLRLEISDTGNRSHLQYKDMFKSVFSKIGDDLAKDYGCLEGTHEENKQAWLTFLDGYADHYDKRLDHFDDLSAYKFILSAFLNEYPELTGGIYILSYTERCGGYDVSDFYDKQVIAQRQENGEIKFFLSEQVKVWQTKEF